MAPQLQINQGPQDALLYDNSKSYFTNVGYTRTSNFQMELRDVDSQNTANLGATANFVIPKAADLLGPCDLIVEFEQPTASPGSADLYWGWVESVGYAMIEKITFSVGTHEVEVLTGEQLNIINELMRDDDHRQAFAHTLKTGRPLVRGNAVGHGSTPKVEYVAVDGDDDSYDRIIAHGSTTKAGKKLIVPLGLFFTKHPSQYFPLAAIAGVNDVRISIKFRQAAEVLMGHGALVVSGSTASTGVVATTGTAHADAALNNCKWSGSAFKECKLRCHYIHVTAPEHDALVNKEHVRLMSMWHGNEQVSTKTITCKAAGNNVSWEIDLPFLHPVKELIITIRKVSEMGSSLATTSHWADASEDHGAQTKNYFAYQGGGFKANIESFDNGVIEEAGTSTMKSTYLKTKNIKLTLNGQSRHLDGQGIDRDYLMNRLLPMMHTNSTDRHRRIVDSSVQYDSTDSMRGHDDLRALGQLMDRKEIYVYPFSLNPEGANPSGAVNFSKVSHAKLSINLDAFATSGADADDVFQCNVYGIHYNWLAIKDGRALTSFA